MTKTFNIKKVDWLKQPMFFGEEPNTQRFDQQKYPVFEKLNQIMRMFLSGVFS